MADAENDVDGYRVGYGKPPKESQFKKGKSGNPRGRRKGSRNSGTLLTNELDELVAIKERGQSKTITKREAIYKQLVSKAASGDTRAMKLIFDNVEKLERQYPERFTAEAELDQRRQYALLKAMTIDERRQYVEIVRAAKQRVEETVRSPEG